LPVSTIRRRHWEAVARPAPKLLRGPARVHRDLPLDRDGHITGNVYKAKYLYDFTEKIFVYTAAWTAKLAVRNLSQVT
jgi:hypothetical protein